MFLPPQLLDGREADPHFRFLGLDQHLASQNNDADFVKNKSFQADDFKVKLGMIPSSFYLFLLSSLYNLKYVIV